MPRPPVARVRRSVRTQITSIYRKFGVNNWRVFCRRYEETILRKSPRH